MDMTAFYERITGGNSVPATILSVSIMLLAGFLVTRITKKLHLPNVTAYIVSGILIGPFCLNLIPSDFVAATGFLPDIALAFIAFGTGEYFKIETLKKNGLKVLVITLFEALTATLLVFVLCYVFIGLSLPFSMVLSALAAATAPASTMMTIRQVHAKGEFVDTLLQVVALDDMVGLIAYSVAISVATTAFAGGNISVMGSLKPFFINLAILVLGGAFGYVLYLFMRNRHSTDNRLIIAIAVMLSFCGIAALFESSPLLGCMAMGAAYINLSDDEGLFKQLNYFSPPILLLFFVRSGISFDLGALFTKGRYGMHPLIFVGVGYFFIRIVGKYLGSYLGCFLTGTGVKVRQYLGLALIPQAGVAIGLAELGARTIRGDAGNALLTIILASSVLYELIGPGAAKLALYMSGSYEPEDDAAPEEDEDNTAEEDNETVSPEEDINGETGNDASGSQNDEKAKKSEGEKEKSKNKSGKNKSSKNKSKKKRAGDEEFENIDEKFFDEGAREYYESLITPEEPKGKKNKKDKDKKEKGKKSKAPDKAKKAT